MTLRTTTISLLLLALPLLAVHADAETSKVLNGRAAIDALGPRITELAKQSGFTSKEDLERTFEHDSTLHVDLSGPRPMLLYIDTNVPPAPPTKETESSK